VQTAVLKLCAGRIDALESEVESAKVDYSDVLAYAEYPAEMALASLNFDESSSEAKGRARQADKKQYLKWWNSR